MPQDWRTQVKTNTRQRLNELATIKARRHQQLAADQKYVVARDRLIQKLGKEYARNPGTVTEFFRLFGWPTPLKLKSLKSYLSCLQDKELKKVLRRYVRFANRFHVIFLLRRKKRHFRPIELLPSEAKFHVQMTNGQLAPLRATYDEEPIDASFQSNQMRLPKPVELVISSGEAKCVQIEDKDGSSVLSTLESFAYFAEGITFIVHQRERPYLFCIVGEKVTNALWRKASRAVSALLHRHHGRERAGRPKDLQKWRKTRRLLKKPGPKKAAAVELAGKAQNVPTQQSYISRHLKELKE
jgi:hypothetical protein